MTFSLDDSIIGRARHCSSTIEPGFKGFKIIRVDALEGEDQEYWLYWKRLLLFTICCLNLWTCLHFSTLVSHSPSPPLSPCSLSFSISLYLFLSVSASVSLMQSVPCSSCLFFC